MPRAPDLSDLHPISGCNNPQRLADVIFVHGLGGDAYATWCCGDDKDSSFPQWLGKDFPQAGIWTLSYASRPSFWVRSQNTYSRSGSGADVEMALHDRSTQVLNRMAQLGLGRVPILFVCHSLGGLLVKQILQDSYNTFEKEEKSVYHYTGGVLFLATPHHGASLASLMLSFAFVFGATISLHELRAHSAQLRSLYDFYRNHALEKQIETVTYFEQKRVRGFTIVKPSSSHPGVGHNPVRLDEDHISICKPCDQDAQVYVAARTLLSNLLNRNQIPSSTQPLPHAPTPQIAPSSSDHIPRQSPPGADHFFGRTTQRKELVARLRERKNSAVAGPGGIGKTALAAEALTDLLGTKPWNLAPSPYPGGIVYLDLYTLKASANAFWSTLAERLTGALQTANLTARQLAQQACLGRRFLLILEGGEEADGLHGHDKLSDLLDVLDPDENRYLLLTRSNDQFTPSGSIRLREALDETDSISLFDSITKGAFTEQIRTQVLNLFQGHPLAITWGCNMLVGEGDSPQSFIADWGKDRLLTLADPTNARHTLHWLFNRSVRNLGETESQALEAAALLAPSAFPLAAITAALTKEPDGNGPSMKAVRDALRSLSSRALLRSAGHVADDDCWQFTHILGHQFARKESNSNPAIRTRLALWLESELQTALYIPSKPAPPEHVGQLLEHLAALLRTDKDQQLWFPLVEKTLYYHQDRLVTLGRLTQAALCLDAVQSWVAQFPTELSTDSYWSRERGVLFSFQGNIQQAQGDLNAALDSYQQDLEVSRHLAGSDPSNTQWQRDLSISLDNVGGIQQAQGDLDAALISYQQSLAIRRTLAASDRSNTQWQRDLSVSLNKVGGIQEAQGDLDAALISYQQSLAIRRTLADSDRSNTEWQRDLSVSLDKVGGIQKAQGDLDAALISYQQSLAIRRTLADSDRSNTEWQRDLGVGFERVGNIQQAQGDLDAALDSYQQYHQIARTLAASDQSNTEWQRDLSVSLNKLAQIYDLAKDRQTALPYAKESLSIAERLAALDQTNVTWQEDAEISRNLIAYLQA